MNVKDRLLAELAAAEGEFISGAGFADRTGVSRNAVWKAVKALEGEGYAVESAAAGYRLSSENNRLSAEIIGNHLEARELGGKIILLDETDSTNNRAKELASEGTPHGTVVIADSQTSGRGRMGRSFFSPSGCGIYMSVIIRPEFGLDAAQLITSCAACAAASAVDRLSGGKTDIKWVNDLYMNGRKICGILTEASLSLENSSLDYAVIGIGINVLSVKESFTPELAEIASSIEDETGVKVSRNKMCAELLNRLEEYLSAIESRAFLVEYSRRELLTGNMITATVGGESFIGKAVGIDDNAALITEQADGTVRILNSGEASLCRVKK